VAVGSQQYALTSTASVIASAPGDALPGGTPVASAQVTIGIPTANIYLGGVNVSSTNGLLVASTNTVPFSVNLYPGDVLYAVTATTATVSVLQT
jgi:hypothetical protein